MPADKNNKAVRDLPKLLKFTGDLVEFTEKLLAQPIRYAGDDHLAFMGLHFVTRQIQFLKTIRLLIEHNLWLSTAPIARAMVEGMCLFLWCANKPSRPLLWRAFSLVKDLRLMRQRESKGEKIDPTTRQKIVDGLTKHGNRLFSREARKARQKGKSPPQDPYIKNWPNITKKQMFDEVQGCMLYSEIYRSMSEPIHWDIASFVTSPSTERSATALAVGFQSLLQSLELLNNHLQLQKGREIDELKQRYIAGLTNLGSNGLQDSTLSGA